MKGHVSGVSTQILREEPRAIYTHCYGYSLNLACQDTIHNVEVDALDTTSELSKLLKYLQAKGRFRGNQRAASTFRSWLSHSVQLDGL